MSDEGTFYLTLPSNSSMKHFPDNNASHFHTKLPRSFHLNSDYEVGLAEIMFPNSYLNISEGECTLDFRTEADTALQHAVVEGGLYNSPVVLINTLNSMVRKKLGEKAKGIKFRYNIPSKRALVVMSTVGAIVGLSEPLRNILNMEKQFYRGVRNVASKGAMDLNREHEAVYVYCDVVEERAVGDAMVPLLRTIPTVGRQDPVIHQIYEKPHFVRLSKHSFETVEILLTRDTGKELSFCQGKCVVTLEFRRRRPRY